MTVDRSDDFVAMIVRMLELIERQRRVAAVKMAGRAAVAQNFCYVLMVIGPYSFWPSASAEEHAG